MESAIRTSLLSSMAAGRLVVLCGAGLSMAPPSGLPSALKLRLAIASHVTLSRYSPVTRQVCLRAGSGLGWMTEMGAEPNVRFRAASQR